MKKKLLAVISLVLVFNIFFGQVLYGLNYSVVNHEKPNSILSSSSITSGNYIKNEVIAAFKNGDTSLILKSPYNKYFKKLQKSIKSIGAADIILNDGISVEQAISALRGDPHISFIQPDYVYKSQSLFQDPMSGDQWGLENDGQPVNSQSGTSGVDIDAAKAWTVTKGSPDVVVAVIDTGIDINHPDLKDNIWVNKKEIAGNGKDDDGNGYVDDVNGWNVADNNGNVYDSASDEDHGTHVAGIIAAEMNNIGTVGVAPNVKIMPIRLGTGNNDFSTIGMISGIDYAEKNGAKIVNMSIGGGYDRALEQRIKKSKMLFVIAASNDGLDNDYQNTMNSYDCDNIIYVAAVDSNGNLAFFSNYGEKSVDVAAPGVNILSTVPKGNSTNYDNAYAYHDGTSMATPYVAGVAALLMSNGITDIGVVKDRIIASCKRLDSLEGKVASCGIVDAYKALTYDQSSEIPGNPLNGQNSGALGSTKSDAVYYVDLKAGDNIALNLTGSNTDNDDDLYLYSPETVTVGSLKNLAASSATAGSNESIDYTVPVSGRYYVDVNCESGLGNFMLNYKMKSQGNDVITEDNSPQLALTGNAQAENSESYSGGSELMLNSQGDISYNFEGSSIDWVGEKNSDQGIADVYIDGSFEAEIDLYSDTPQYQQQLFYKSLSSGKHTIDVRWAGTCHTGGQSDTINVDYFKSTINTGLSVPTGLTATSGLDQIEISFDNMFNDSVTEYKIYRSTDGVNYSYLDAINLMSTSSKYSYNDAGAFGLVNCVYYYKITAVLSSGIETEFSDVVSARPIMPNYCGTIHSDSDKITYTGDWVKATSASGKTTYSTTQKLASVSLLASGEAIQIDHDTSAGEIGIVSDGSYHGYGWPDEPVPMAITYLFPQKQINANLKILCESGEVTISDIYIYDNNPDYPSSPENLSASNGDNEVDLNWKSNSDSNLTGYNIYRSTDNTSFDKINSTPVKDPKYADTNVNNGVTYFYTVTAVNSAGKECRLKASGVAQIQYFIPLPTVTNVTVTPTETSVVQGKSVTFSATVTGKNNPLQTVAWSVSGNNSPNTTIDSDGKLTVGVDETAANLNVTAISTADATKSATASVTVLKKSVTGIKVKSAPSKIIYAANQKLDLSGCYITATYNDGSTQDVKVVPSMVSGFNSTRSGLKTIKVTYKGKTTTFNVTVDANFPVIKIAPYMTSPTNKNITVTVTVNKGTLNATSHTFTENGSFDFIATDAAGNVTKKTVTITNIDKMPPTIMVKDTSKTIIGNGGTSKNDVIVISTGYSFISVKLNGKLIAWPSNNTFTKNGSYTIKATDNAGNSCTVTFIIKK